MPLLLRIVVHGPRAAGIERLRAILDLHAWVEDVHLYSDIMISYQLTLRGERLAEFAAAIMRAGMTMDAKSVEALEAARSKAPQETPDVTALLNATFPDADPDAKREVPHVPG